MARDGQTGQHGPEMDDTQVAATGELRDQLPPVEPSAGEGAGDDGRHDDRHDGGELDGGSA